MLNLSQPAVTHAIRQIEEELSVALFERRRSGMSATDCGKIVVHRTGRAMEHLRQAAKSLDRFKTADSRTKSSFPIYRLITNRQLDSLIALSESRNVGRARGSTGCLRNRGLPVAEGIGDRPPASGFFYRHQAMNPTPAGEMLVTRGKLAQAELRLMLGRHQILLRRLFRTGRHRHIALLAHIVGSACHRRGGQGPSESPVFHA